MGGLRRGVSAVVVVAIVIVATVGVSAFVLYSSPPGKGGGNATTATSFEVNNFSTSYSTTTYLPPSTMRTTNQTNPGGWQAWAVANITLGDYRVQAYIHDAYNYSFSISQTGASPILVSTLISAFGPQVVQGNWTSGYTITFSYHCTLNVTTQYTPPFHYQIINVGIRNSTVPGYWSMAYDVTQQKAISIAMTNISVKGYMSQYPSYVNGAFLFPPANKTFGGDYLVLLYQLHGAKILGAFVNLNTVTVVSTYQTSRATKTCFSNGACWTSPWGS